MLLKEKSVGFEEYPEKEKWPFEGKYLENGESIHGI
jgi:hypothetical protein